MKTKSNIIVQTVNLKKYFPVQSGFFKRKSLHAVDNINLSIFQGEIIGLVGESGCGKSTLAYTIFHLCPPTEGDIFFDGEKITAKNRSLFTSRMQLVFQNSYASMNPRLSVGETIREALEMRQQPLTSQKKNSLIGDYLENVGLDARYATRYPHELSGGQQQRIGIARALAVQPDFITLDEPVSALDVSIQSQIINLLLDLQEKFNLTYLFITHDLLVAHFIATRICVMYLGKIVELATCEELFNLPIHPYTQALLSAIPIPDPQKSHISNRIILEGNVPSPIDLPNGCSFYGRCNHAKDCCKVTIPELKEVAPEHFVACHLV
jgi:oligopeptide transport system ATP-binding protein